MVYHCMYTTVKVEFENEIFNHVVVLLHAVTIVDGGEDVEERVLARELHKRLRLLWMDVACHMRCRCSSGECPLLSIVVYQPFYFNASLMTLSTG